MYICVCARLEKALKSFYDDWCASSECPTLAAAASDPLKPSSGV